MRSITGAGLIILAFMMFFGLSISAFVTGTLRASSSANLLMEMQEIKPLIESSCQKAPGVYKVNVTDEENETEEVIKYSTEVVPAPIYPTQFNCMTCDQLFERVKWQGVIGATMMIAEIADIRHGIKKAKNAVTGDVGAKVLEEELDDIMKEVSDEMGEELGEAASDAAKKAIKEKLDKGESFDDATKAGITAVARETDPKTAAKFSEKFYVSVDSHSKGAVEITQEGVERTINEALDDANLEMAETLDDYGTIPGYDLEASDTARYMQQQVYNEALANTASKETLEAIAKKGYIGRVKSWAKSIGSMFYCAPSGFVSAFSRGGIVRAGEKTIKAGGKKRYVCAAAYAVGVGVSAPLLYTFVLKNYEYVQKDINRYIQMLEAVEDHFETLEKVLGGIHTGIPIGMDVGLIVSEDHPNFSHFQKLAEEATAYNSEIIVKSRQIDSILYDIIYNKLNDPSYAEYYFSTKSETRPSNTLYTPFVMGPLSDENQQETMMRIRPQHVSAIIVNTRLFLDRRSENYPTVNKLINERFDRLNENYRYMELKKFINFLVLLESGEEEAEWESIDLPEPEEKTSIIDLLEQEEINDPDYPINQQLTRDVILDMILDLKEVESLVNDIEYCHLELMKIQDRAWSKLSATKCNSDPIILGDLKIIKSECAVVTNCNWDYVMDYSYFENEDFELGDCVQLSVVVNEPVATDPLTGDAVWRTMPAFRIDREYVTQLIGMLTKAANVGYARTSERIALGASILGGSLGRMANSWTDAGAYCNVAGRDPKEVMMCCMEVVEGCDVGLCRICDTIVCDRPINIEPRLQPSIVVDTTSKDEIKIIGNVGILS